MSAISADHNLIELIKAQLEGLRKTPDGLFLYRMIDRGLKNRGGEYTGDTGRDFISFLHALLHKYAANPDGDTVTRIKVRLLQQRLAPHLSGEEEKAVPEPTPVVINTPPKPEEVIIEGLPDEPETPVFEVTDDAAPAEPSEKPVEDVPVSAQSVDRQSSSKTMQPEALEIDGLELDESTFEKELKKRTANDPEEEKPVEIEFDNPEEIASKTGKVANNLNRESRDAKAEAIKASMKPLIDIDEGPEPSATPSAIRHDHHEIEITADDDLSFNEPADEKNKSALTGKAVANKDKPARFSISDHVPDDVKEELLRGNSGTVKPKPSQPLSIDSNFNNLGGTDDVDTPDIVVGEEGFVTAPEPAPPAAGAVANASEAIPAVFVSGDGARNSSRDRVDKLHETFAGKLADSISRSREYHSVLKTNLKALKLAVNPDDVIDIKHLLVMGLEDLLKGNQALGKDLGATNHYLKISQLDRDLLKDELGRARDQSLVDELTGLQNKVAFGKQVEAEIGRSKRYGFSLALSVIVLDRLDTYREQNGKDAGDEVIRTFANQLLTGFRGYDAVARLHDNKFGVLFPNTQKEGALSALEKAQKRVADTVIQFNGKSLRLPTFTSSLTLYSPGDKPEALMKRAYDALAVANENTRDKIIVALAQT